ncbi:hypothetical protein DPMN_189751 [Dreissena polymorpha]|uniref:Uncharacterized protein n=1 Tax=Dreissena polymorpha TaxID=45954 RepID=A0A9D4DTQ0_DREPO|nr:hypothetical protein DPMN_189751 [Dreissena polymorpha]
MVTWSVTVKGTLVPPLFIVTAVPIENKLIAIPRRRNRNAIEVIIVIETTFINIKNTASRR